MPLYRDHGCNCFVKLQGSTYVCVCSRPIYYCDSPPHSYVRKKTTVVTPDGVCIYLKIYMLYSIKPVFKGYGYFLLFFNRTGRRRSVCHGGGGDSHLELQALHGVETEAHQQTLPKRIVGHRCARARIEQAGITRCGRGRVCVCIHFCYSTCARPEVERLLQ